jgi:hypothetical protein
MHLAPGSDLIDAGVNVGLPYSGSLPDLGCFETSVTGVQNTSSPVEIFCYPNPLHERGNLQFNLSYAGRCEIRLYDRSGRYVKILADQVVEPGVQNIPVDLSDLRDGLYICRIFLNQVPVLNTKLLKQ